MKYYLIAGEASGDLHGSKLIEALKIEDPDAQFRAWGGDLMQAAGAILAKHIRDLAIMGIGQVLRRLPEILRNFSFCRRDIAAFAPDVIILIDYSGFNLRIAPWAKKQGYKIFYYISPQIWATREGRIKKIKHCIDKMFCILPFEQDFYHKHGYEVEFIGHPLLDTVQNTLDSHSTTITFQRAIEDDRDIVALLPGSRRQEVKAMLALMLSTVQHFPEKRFIVAAAPSLSLDFYQNILSRHLQGQKVEIVQGQTYALLSQSKAALVTSGTATLEAALFGVPQVVCYKTGPIFYWIVKQIIKIPFISLVNIILGRTAVKELIQGRLNPENLKKELQALLYEEATRKKITADYAELRQRLGQRGAARRAAQTMIEILNPKN